MFYTVYKITNNINGKIYIGVHQTNDLNDTYMGSGNSIKKSIKKYGVENFTKEYIKVFDNKEDMFNMESTLVNEEFVSRSNTYNIKVGGFGGWCHIDKENAKNAFRKWFYNKYKTKEETIKYINDRISIPYIFNGYEFKGKKHTDKTKKLIGDKNKISQLGSKNSNYGKSWCVHKDVEDLTSRKCYNKNDIPLDWITTTEWRENKKSKDKHSYGKHWYNDGVNNYFMFESQATHLHKGRLKN